MAFVDLGFSESAALAFSRAAELADTDVHEEYAGSWIIEDRRLGFVLEAETSRTVVEAMKRFLTLLSLQAESGEANIEIREPRESWLRRAASPSISKEIALVIDDENTLDDCPQTLRAAAG